MVEVLLWMPDAESVERQLFGRGWTLHAPHLLDIEVAQVVRRYTAGDEIDESTGRAALVTLAELPLRRYPHGVLLPRIWDLRHNFTAYDAAYVALAEALDATLLTRDRRLAASARRHARVELV